MLSVVAARYANALVDVVLAPNSGVDSVQVIAQLREVQALIDSSAELKSALLSPAVAPARKRAVIQSLTGSLGLLKPVLNFLYVVIDHRRTADFHAIVDGFEILLDERLGYVRADVSTAKELSDSQRANLEAQIAKLAGKKAKLKFSTDPTLVAGVVARVGSTVYDGSVRGQLEQLRTKLGR